MVPNSGEERKQRKETTDGAPHPSKETTAGERKQLNKTSRVSGGSALRLEEKGKTRERAKEVNRGAKIWAATMHISNNLTKSALNAKTNSENSNKKHKNASKRKRNKKKDNILKQIQNSVDQLEKVMKQIAENKDDKEGKFDKSRAVNTGRTSIASARRVIDMNLKQGTIDEPSVVKQKADIAKYEKEIEAMSEQIKKEQAQKLKDIETALSGGAAQKQLSELEAAVEKTKDAAVLFTCEMAEHIKPEDAIESHDKTEAEAKVAHGIIKTIKETLFAKEKDLRTFPPAETEKIRTQLKEVQTKVTGFERELLNVKGQSASAVKKANAQLAKRKREEAIEQQKKEREAVAQWNRDILGFIYQVNLIAEDLSKNLSGKSLQQLSQAEARAKGLKAELTKRQNAKECNGNSKKELARQLAKMDSGLERIQKARTEVQNRDHDKLDMLGIQIAVAARALQGDKKDDVFFAELTSKAAKMSTFHFEKLVKKLNVECDCASMLFSEICQLSGSGNDTLTCEEFFLHGMHNYFEVIRQTFLTVSEDANSDKVEGTLEKGTMVDLIEGPVEVSESHIRAKCKVVSSKGETKEGWVTLRRNSNEALKRFSPLYTVLTETVLTDTYSLKGFKVVRRIKKDEKFRALTLPTFSEEAEMLRVRGITSENELAWITVQGNRGTPLLKNEPIQKEDQKEIETEEFSDDLLHTLLENMANKEREQADQLQKDTTEHVSVVTKAVAELAEIDGEGKEPTKEEVDALCVKVDEAFRTALRCGSEAKQKIQNMSKQISNVEAGPYKDLRASLTEILEAVSKSVAEVTGLREKQREHSVSVKKKEKERRDAKELAESEALAEKIMAEVELHQDAVVDMHSKLTEISLTDEAKKNPTEIASELEKIRALVTEAEALGDKVKAWLQENQPKQPHGCLQKASQALAQCRQKTMRTLQAVAILKKNVVNLEAIMKEKSQVLIGVTLSKHLVAKKMTSDELFVSIAKGDTMEIAALDKYLSKLGCKSPCLELICKGLGTPLSKDLFQNLVQVNYRCVKRCLLTDQMEVPDCKKLRTIEPEEIVTILEAHVTDPETGVTRIRAKACNDDMEGWMPIVGNCGSEYFKLRGPWYKVVRDTVFTDDFSMTNVKVIRRLKVGDKLRCLQYPKIEDKSGLLRMQAVSLDENKTTGWVTIKGNQGSMYVVDCDLEPEKKDEDKDEDMKDAAEQTAPATES